MLATYVARANSSQSRDLSICKCVVDYEEERRSLFQDSVNVKYSKFNITYS